MYRGPRFSERLRERSKLLGYTDFHKGENERQLTKLFTAHKRFEKKAFDDG